METCEKGRAPHATGGVDVNFMTDDGTDRITSAYGSNFTRLALIKAKYDPKNLFRVNQNITPANQPSPDAIVHS